MTSFSSSQFNLKVFIVAGVHKASSVLSVQLVADRRDCVPKFMEDLYTFTVLSNSTYPTAVGEVEARECGGGNLQLAMESSDNLYLASNGTVIVLKPLPENRKTSSAIVTAR